jgi:hypothetical protein
MNAMFVFVAALELRARKLRALIVSGVADPGVAIESWCQL